MRNAKDGKETEAVVLQAILAWLKAQGFWVWRSATQGQIRHGAPGTAFLTPSAAPGCPDILGVLPDGKALMIEVKKPGWKPPREPAGCKASAEWSRYALQRSWIDRCNKNNGIALFAQCVEEVEYILGQYIVRKGQEVFPPH